MNFEQTRLAFKVVRAGIELCRAKGYRRIYGHAQKRLLNFWGRFGFRPFEGGREFVFSDFDYVEIVLDTTPHPQAISIGVDPYVMIRPEGRWHVPGILERSAIRPVTRPSVGIRRAHSSCDICDRLRNHYEEYREQLQPYAGPFHIRNTPVCNAFHQRFTRPA